MAEQLEMLPSEKEVLRELEKAQERIEEVSRRLGAAQCAAMHSYLIRSGQKGNHPYLPMAENECYWNVRKLMEIDDALNAIYDAISEVDFVVPVL